MGPWIAGTIALAVFAVLLVAVLMWHDNRRVDKWIAELEADLNNPDDGLGGRSL